MWLLQNQILLLLEFFGETIIEKAEEDATTFDAFSAQWLFALLAYLDERLVGDDISRLRTVARACLFALRKHRSLPVEHNIESELGYWMIVCIVAGVWAQHDLWDDAANV